METITQAKETDQRRREVGIDQVALDTVGRAGFGNAAFEFSEEEIPEVLDEFNHREENEPSIGSSDRPNQPNGLKEKLDLKSSMVQQGA